MATVDRDQLLVSAKDFAERALNAYLDSDTRVILVYAAFSMEHLSKAYLCDLHPALLAEIRNGQVDALLHLVDLGSMARKATHPRTISAKEALARVEHVLPTLTVPKALLHELIEVRDGVVHVGHLGGTSTREILTAFLRYADALYNEMGTPQDERWGDYLSLVDSLVTQSLDDIGQRVARKFAIAKRRYADLMRGLSLADQARVRDDLKRRGYNVGGSTERNTSTICPICDNDYVQLTGETNNDPRVNLSDVDSVPASWEVYARFFFIAQTFECGVCGLTLSSTDELRVAKLETAWERWLLIWSELRPLQMAMDDKNVRAYRELKPVGSRPPPYPQHPAGYFAGPAEEN